MQTRRIALNDNFRRKKFRKQRRVLARRLLSYLKLMPVQPIANNLIGFHRLLPKEAMATALNHLALGVFNFVAQVLGRDDVIAGVGVDPVFSADDAKSRNHNLN